MLVKYHYFNCYLILCVLLLPSVFNSLKAQEIEENRLNLELSTGLSSFKEADGFSPNVAGNFTLSLWTPEYNIFSFETFFTGWSDYFIDYSVLYGKMLPFKKKKKSFICLHGGMGYLKIIKQDAGIDFNKRTIGLTAELKAGWAFEKGWFGILLYQKYSFVKSNHINGASLIFSINLNKAIPM